MSSPKLSSPAVSLKFVVAFVALPYLAGYFLSASNLEKAQQILAPLLSAVNIPNDALSRVLIEDVARKPMDADACYKKLVSNFFTGGTAGGNLEHFKNLSVILHRNGQADACGSTERNLSVEFQTVLEDMRQAGLTCPSPFEKYQVEALMTRLFHKLTTSSCHSQESDRSADAGLYGFCDMGESKTPILLDHYKLVPVTVAGDQSYLPCHFHNANGVRVTSLQQLSDLAQRAAVPNNKECNAKEEEGTCSAAAAATLRELHLYAVPAGRVFMHAASYVGQIIDLPHVRGGDPEKPVYLEVLSVSPAVFDLHNFFTRAESLDLVDRALAETKESHRIKRSTTGNVGAQINQRRTSESGYDTDGKTSVLVKKRCFDVLGFDEYIESHADGLQILRYNLTTAYIPHLDYLDIDEHLEHDYDSSGKGGNRFATILLYMTDLEEKDGGETVFTEAWPTGQPVEDRVDIKTALNELRESDQRGILEEGSWQETMVAQCRSRLAIRPNSARAVLFYSQLPNGKEDPKSLHGGCPVLAGMKYAANLWVWSTPRAGYPGNPKNPKYKGEDGENEDEVPKGRVTATFRNEGNDPLLENAKLYFHDGKTDMFWGNFGHGDPALSVNTYKSHVWKVMVDGEVRRTWTIESEDPPTQEFVV